MVRPTPFLLRNIAHYMHSLFSGNALDNIEDALGGLGDFNLNITGGELLENYNNRSENISATEYFKVS